MPLSKDLREFVALLNSNKVDLLIRATPENVKRVLLSISQLGFDSLGISAQDLLVAGRVVQFGVRPNRVDLITSISGIGFDEAWDTRSNGSLDGIPASFIGKDALIRNKESTGRAKDLGDAEELRKRPT